MEKYDEQIERYVLGEMTPGEQTEFELLMENDAELKEMVELQQSLQEVYHHQDEFELDDKLNDILDKEPLPQIPTRLRPARWKSWGWGALLVVALLTGSIVYLSSNQLTEQQEAAYAVAEPFENTFNLSSQDQSDLAKGMAAYDEGNYATAIRMLQKAGNDPEVRFYLAISYLLDHQPQEALSLLEELDQLNDPVLQTSITWYKGLAQVAAGQYSTGADLLRSIQDSPKYKDKVEYILDKN